MNGIKTFSGLTILLFLVCTSRNLLAETAYPSPLEIPVVKNFLGNTGFGQRHPSAPSRLEDFGQLAGVWDASLKMRGWDGTMQEAPPALWIWKYDLEGFIVRDLFFHSQDHLPPYLAAMNRPYLLTAMRSFDPKANRWNVAWSANSAGASPSDSSGNFEATLEGDNVVMLSNSDFGHQRVTFSDISPSQFRWTSEYSTDHGQTWVTAMEIIAKRRSLH